MSAGTIRLIGCSILTKEIVFLVTKNRWHVQSEWLPSALHVNFGELFSRLSDALERTHSQPLRVFYGACHPRIDELLAAHGALRPRAQNCVELLLGHDAFEHHMERGAFFLLEQWARRWESIVEPVFGNEEIMGEIFRGAHTHLLAIRTPLSGDFSSQAESLASRLRLPLEWLDTELDLLEQTLRELLTVETPTRPCATAPVP